MEKQHTVLAVDDESDILLTVKMTLESEGYRVLTASDGPAALETARSEQPDLVLLDVIMPGMDGFEVVEGLRENETTSDIPVVMVTVLSEHERKIMAAARGVKHYIVKPFEVEELVAKVRLAIEDAEMDAFL